MKLSTVLENQNAFPMLSSMSEFAFVFRIVFAANKSTYINFLNEILIKFENNEIQYDFDDFVNFFSKIGLPKPLK